jgi:hypothetical protein
VRRAPLLLSSLLALAFAAPQDAPPAKPAAEYDKTPNDPAASGFLSNQVDAKVYSLEAAGAAKLVTTVHAAWDGRPDAPPPFDFEIACDYQTGAVTTRPLANPAESVKPLVGMLYGYGQAVIAMLPSRQAGAYVVNYAKDGELIRLDFKPRNPASNERTHQEWFKKDGTPVRRKVDVNGADGKPLSFEVESDYKEADGRLLLATQKPVDPKVRFAMEFEYEKVDGFRVLKRITQKTEEIRLVIDFKTKVEAASK